MIAHALPALTLAGASLAQSTAPSGTTASDQLMVWAVVCFVVAIVLFALELMIPSGGILGLFAAISVVVGIVMMFRVDTTLGLIGIAMTLLALPVAMLLAFRFLPHSPVFKLATLDDSERERDADDSDEKQARALVGLTGEALTPLRPVGDCRIDGVRVQCVATVGRIEQGTRVEAVSYDGMNLKVRPAEPETGD